MDNKRGLALFSPSVHSAVTREHASSGEIERVGYDDPCVRRY